MTTSSEGFGKNDFRLMASLMSVIGVSSLVYVTFTLCAAKSAVTWLSNDPKNNNIQWMDLFTHRLRWDPSTALRTELHYCRIFLRERTHPGAWSYCYLRWEYPRRSSIGAPPEWPRRSRVSVFNARSSRTDQGFGRVSCTQHAISFSGKDKRCV